MPLIYRVIGTLAVPANKANPGVGQSINYSFELDYTNAGSNLGYPTIVGVPNVISCGPLGEFELKTVSSQNYVGFLSPVAEIDLLFQSLAVPPPPVISGQSWLYSCTGVATGDCAPFNLGPGVNIYGTACAAVYKVTAAEPRPAYDRVHNISSR